MVDHFIQRIKSWCNFSNSACIPDSYGYSSGGLSLGMALLHSGLLDHYAGYIKQMEVHYIILLLLFAFLTMILSNIMSHTATSTVLIPLGMAILVNAQSEVALIIGLAASTALFLPVSTPPNAIAYSTEMLDIKDFRTGGILVGVLGPILIVLWILFLFWFVRCQKKIA